MEMFGWINPPILETAGKMDDFGGGDAWINKPILFQSQGQWMNFGD
jgi:hypothetical protein